MNALLRDEMWLFVKLRNGGGEEGSEVKTKPCRLCGALRPSGLLYHCIGAHFNCFTGCQQDRVGPPIDSTRGLMLQL